MITFGSLFTGIGGFDIAFTNSGMKCLWQCEIDEKAVGVLKKHADYFNHPEIHNDVRKIGKETLKPVDVICGGFPCQDLSVAGKRKGLAGERSGLWFEFARIIDELEPRWVVIENVPGFLSSEKGKDFEVVIRWMAERGYGVCWRVLDAQYFGVPQRRRRVFIVASFRSGNCAKVLFEPESMRRDHSESREAGKEVAFTLRTSPACDKGDGGINTTLVTDTLTTNGDAHSGFRNGEGLVTGTLDAKAGSSSRHGSGNETEFLVSGSVTAKWAKGTGGPAGDEAYNLVSAPITTRPYADNEAQDEKLICWEMQHAAEAYREAGNIAPSLQARMGTGGNQVPMVGVRRLTPLECERLQGFPDNWTADQADSARYKQCGNAVAVPVVEWIGRRIVEVEDASI